MLEHDSAGQDPAVIQRMLTALAEANLMGRLLGFTPTMFMPMFAQAPRLASLFNADYFAAFRDLDRASLLLNNLDVKGRLQGRAPVHQSLYLWSKTALPGYILTLLGDRMEMAHSVEGRVPFLDHKVGEILMQTAVHLKIRGMTEKFLLREATRDVITDTVYRRQKHPFLSPPDASGAPSKMATLIQDTLRSSVVDSVPAYNGAAVRSFADQLETMGASERRRVDTDLMMLMSQIFLYERFVQPSAG
jgi:asparagine synthase (glutamine-hydrolysing)